VDLVRAYDALVLDLDGTLVDSEDRIHSDTQSAIADALAAGVVVMVATGRSEPSTIPILNRLKLTAPAIVYNGGALFCPVSERFLERRFLSDRTVRRTIEFARGRACPVVVMRAGVKYADPTDDPMLAKALADMTLLEFADVTTVGTAEVIRITVMSNGHGDSASLYDDLAESLGEPNYMTHFPLNVLPHHRDSPFQVTDIQPPCEGKAEAFRVLREIYGIEPERVVTVGDATNDLPMLAGAGLAVVIENGHPEARALADRLIPGPETGAIGSLVRGLFAV
jgi:Cof subfamily protein (haloacid dehalogenase superfamily)